MPQHINDIIIKFILFSIVYSILFSIVNSLQLFSVEKGICKMYSHFLEDYSNSYCVLVNWFISL